MSKETVSLSDQTNIGLPLRNLIGLATAVAIGTWAWFGLQERLNKLETNQILMQKSVEQNENFRIKWPRGELGALPADAEQFMLLEHLAKEFAKLQVIIETGKAPYDQQQALTLDFFKQRIENLERHVEALKDKQAEMKANGHNIN
jgi:phage shock protein A|tara:strand:- start:337 stop:774 length:438 start_codon:yes stop_codon:yes gene_type:complete